MGPLKPTFLAAIGLFSLACEDRPPLPPVIFEGEHIRYRTFEPSEDVCAGSFFVQDTKAGHLKELFNSDETVDFSWIPDSRYLDYCPAPQACAIGSQAFALDPVSEHELLHATRQSTYLPLEEGLAVYFGDGGGNRDVSFEGTFEALLRTDVEFEDYGRLGRFVSYLVEEFGLESVILLSSLTPGTATPTEFEDEIATVLGEPLTALISDFEERYPECTSNNYRHDQPYCGQPPLFSLPTDFGETFESSIELPCDDERTLGSRSGSRWRYETFFVPERRLYNLTISPENDATSSHVILEQCETSCYDQDYSSALTSYEEESVCLDAGTYLMRLKVSGTRSFEISATPTGTCI